MKKYALQLIDITKKYPDGDQENLVLDQINLDVNEGEFVAIVGPSGSGKSTLLSIAGALLSPSNGQVRIKDELISNEKQSEWTNTRRNKIGFIFQNYQLLPYLNTKEQLQLVSKMSGNGVHAEELIDDLGLRPLIHKYPAKMSGGEKQRVAIARAFMNNPDVIFADEPTASLDATRGRQVVELIRDEVKKYNKAAIMVTHDERVLDLVDTVYHLDNAKLRLAKKKN